MFYFFFLPCFICILLPLLWLIIWLSFLLWNSSDPKGNFSFCAIIMNNKILRYVFVFVIIVLPLCLPPRLYGAPWSSQRTLLLWKRRFLPVSTYTSFRLYCDNDDDDSDKDNNEYDDSNTFRNSKINENNCNEKKKTTMMNNNEQ